MRYQEPRQVQMAGAPSGRRRDEPLLRSRLDRRQWLGLALLTATSFASSAASIPVEVWKSPTCGCCGDWIKQMEASGFSVKTYSMGNADIRKGLKMPDKFGSCHTALVQGYALEGHVPPRDVQRLLRERPKAVGLAVPGMPIGSPGMDGPDYAGRRDPYDVLLVQADGSSSVFQAYR